MNATTTTTTEVVDEGRRRDRRGRVTLPRERREELLADYDRSGLSQTAFARRVGVRYPTFAHWVQARRRAGARPMSAIPASPPPSPSAMRFVELCPPSALRPAPPPSPPPPLTITHPELTVTLPDGLVLRGAEPIALAALVRALRET